MWHEKPMLLLQQFLQSAFSHMIFSIPVLSNLLMCNLSSARTIFIQWTQKFIVCDVSRSLSKLFLLTFVLMWRHYAIKLHPNQIYLYWPHTKFLFLITWDPDVFWTSTTDTYLPWKCWISILTHTVMFSYTAILWFTTLEQN